MEEKVLELRELQRRPAAEQQAGHQSLGATAMDAQPGALQVCRCLPLAPTSCVGPARCSISQWRAGSLSSLGPSTAAMHAKPGALLMDGMVLLTLRELAWALRDAEFQGTVDSLQAHDMDSNCRTPLTVQCIASRSLHGATGGHETDHHSSFHRWRLSRAAGGAPALCGRSTMR